MKMKDIAAEFPGICIVHQKIRGHTVADHQHDEHEFFMPLQGEIQIQAADKCLKAGAGHMIYLPPSTVHSFRSDGLSQGERLILIIEQSAWKRRLGGKFSPSVHPASQLCKEILFQLLIHPKTKAASALIETLIQTLSEMLEGNAIEGNFLHIAGHCEDPRIRKSLEIIEENYAATISVEKVARQAGMSARNFSRLFLAELGMTPKEVVTLLRIERAKQLLSSGQHSVTDIAFEVGYGSVSQFISTFRKNTGQLPSSLLPR